MSVPPDPIPALTWPTVFDAVAAINAQFTGYIPTATTRIGVEHIAVADAPPRVVWVPLSDSIDTGPLPAGALPDGDGSLPAVKAIGVCTTTFRVHLWTKADVAIDQDPSQPDQHVAQWELSMLSRMRDVLFLACRDIGIGAIEVRGGNWRQTGEEYAQYGRELELTVAIESPIAPVTDDVNTFVTILHAQMTSGTKRPDGTEEVGIPAPPTPPGDPVLIPIPSSP
jgi:hypothetical protein